MSTHHHECNGVHYQFQPNWVAIGPDVHWRASVREQGRRYFMVLEGKVLSAAALSLEVQASLITLLVRKQISLGAGLVR
jgi:hypothetical protein